MILDIILIVILVGAALLGRRNGLFKTVALLLSFVLAAVCTALLGGSIRAWATGTALYTDMHGNLTEAVTGILESGKTELIEPFLQEGASAQAAALAADGIANAVLSLLIFVAFFVLIRICITLLDKTVFHLPLIRPVNKLLGMLVSFCFALIVLYLAVGAIGGIALHAENSFFAVQLQDSILVRSMYENNFVLDILKGKG